jgi:hypothetical protein
MSIVRVPVRDWVAETRCVSRMNQPQLIFTRFPQEAYSLESLIGSTRLQASNPAEKHTL